MKHITLILAFIMMLPSYASADLYGSMDCKIKSNDFLIIDEGKPSRIENMKDGLFVGNMLTLTYTTFMEVFKLSLSDFKKTTVPARYLTTLAYNEYNKENEMWGSGGGYGIMASGGEYKIYIGPDYISSKGNGVLNGLPSKEHLNMNRYYKNDWQGMVVRTNGLMTHVYTLDCRHNYDQLDDFLAQMKSIKLSR